MTNPDLIKIKCTYAKKCPGCPKIQFVYAKQVHDKQKDLDQLFGPLVTKSGVKVSPVVRSPLQKGYRTTSKLALHQDNFGRRSIGIYERNSKDVVDIPDCPVHDPAINTVVEKMFRRPGTLPFEFYNHTKKAFQDAKLKFVTIRLGADKNQPGVILSHTGISDDNLRAWVSETAAKGASVWACRLKPEDKDLVLNETMTHLTGPQTIPFAVGALQIELHPASFFQANASLSPDFLAFICDQHRGHEGHILLDLYGGFGAYSLSLASEFKMVHLVDGNREAAASAKRSADRLGATNIIPKAQFCEAFLKELTASDRRGVTDIIINPPRAGLSETVRKAVSKSQFPALRRATYVSCNPMTLKRDLEAILKSGGRITAVQPFDMFPQTGHIETVVRLSF